VNGLKPLDRTPPRHAAGWYQVELRAASADAAQWHLRVEHDDGSVSIPLPRRVSGILRIPVFISRAFASIQPEHAHAGFTGDIELFRLEPLNGARAVMAILCCLRKESGRADILRLASYLAQATIAVIWGGPAKAAKGITSRFLHESQFRDPTCPVRIRGRWWQLRGEFRPDHQLGAIVESGNFTWQALGEDPRFVVWRHGQPVGFKAGWYRFSIKMLPGYSALVAPALYPDYGAGYSHEEMIALPDPFPGNTIDALVLFKWDVHALRFDPSIRRARFGIADCCIARLGRAGALLRMLVAEGRRPGIASCLEITRAAIAFIRKTAKIGMSDATADLFARQQLRAGHTSGYADWVRRYDMIDKTELTVLRERASRITDGPLISILLPVYNTPERWLRRCIDSVLHQAYPHWELCIADDASPQPHVVRVLQEYAARDRRIRLCLRDHNGHIAEASNSALALATGSYVGLLDHDDELRPHALLEMAEAIVADPQAALLYSDEDKLDADGRRCEPNFKPDWNYELLLSQNYMCHFTVARADLVRAVGGFRRGFEGSQDHDLVLRCVERLEPTQIVHIPRVLYHWRAVEGSTALRRDAKDYAADAGLRAVAEHLQRTGARASARALPHGHYRITWALPEPPPRISIVIPTRDRAGLLRACVQSILARSDYDAYEIVVIDNQSRDPEALDYLNSLREQQKVRVLEYLAPFNYSAINNWAVAQCNSELVCLLNNDIEVITPGWLAEMAGHAMRPEVGAVGAMLYYPDRSIQHAGVVLGVGGIANHAFQHAPAGSPGFCARALVAQSLSAVTGACLMVRRATYLEVGGLDERLAVAFNDVDLCLRLREAGYRNIWTPFAELYHHESASRGHDDTPEKRARFVAEVEAMHARWGELLQRDPAYNPNLSLEDECYALAFPPR
jgi:GT2 family glycosyltransferase